MWNPQLDEFHGLSFTFCFAYGHRKSITRGMRPRRRQLKQHIECFINLVRRISSDILVPMDALLFGAAKCRVPRLASICMISHTAAIKWLPVLPHEVALGVNRIIVSMVQRLNKTTVQRLRTGSLPMVCKQISFRECINGSPSESYTLGS